MERVEIIGAAAAVGVVAALVGLGVVLLALRRDPPPPVRGLLRAVALSLAAAFLAHVLLLTRLPADWTQVLVGIAAAAITLGAVIVAWTAVSGPAAPRADAVEPVDDGRVRELEEINRRFELALSSANVTVFDQDADLRYAWLHNPRPGLTAAAAGEAMPGTEPPGAVALKREVLATGETRTGGVVVALRDGGVHHFDLTFVPTRDADGAVDGLLGTAVDVTERRLLDVRLAAMAAQAAAAYRRFDLALEDSAITVFEQDAGLRYTFMHNPPPGTEPEDFLGRTDAEVFGQRNLGRLSALKRRVVESGEREAAELDLEIGGAHRFYALRVDAKTGELGDIEGVIGTAVDLTERRRHEQSLRVVMRELTHRSKNLLAVVQAMARKTASAAPDTETFVRDFSSRLRAIAAAHDLLVAESWSGADLRGLLAASLSQSIDPEGPGVRVEGPDLKLAPDAAQMLALAFHELTMNAVKHGSLRDPGGRIVIDWHRDGDEVRLRWREEGGPPVAPPERSGFGRVLLERLVGASLGGTVSLDFRPDGLVCALAFPKDRLIAA